MSALDTPLQERVDHALAVLREARDVHGQVTFANSLGAEDVVITDLIATEVPEIEIFSIDTGRLPEETLQLLARIEAHYGIRVQLFFPDAKDVEAFVRDNGINAFYRSVALRKGCCQVRKVEPLKRALAGKQAWVTGIRREQAVTRDGVEFSEWDAANGLYKINPLADWSEKEVWAYIRDRKLPYNALHDRHYPSIGCAPCTRAVTPGEDVRSGRWWWENPELRECGLHSASSVITKAS